MAKTNPFDFVNSISFTKVHMMEDNPHIENDYDAFIVNRALSYFADTIMFANEANQINNVVDKRLLYDHLFYSIRKERRFSGNWGKRKNIDNLDIIRDFFHYNNQKAIAALSILTDEQIEKIKETRNTGGLDK